MPTSSLPGRLIISLMALLSIGAAHGGGFIDQDDVYVTPSNLEKVVADPDKFNLQVGCFDGYSGAPFDCSFTLWVSYPPATTPAYLANGGHYHDLDSRPLIYRQRHFAGNRVIYDGPGSLAYPLDTNPDPKVVQGETLPAGYFPGVPYADRATIEYPLPEVSGEVQMDIQATILAPTWYCASNCYTAKMFWWRNLFHVGVQGLVEVPDPGPDDHYIKSRGADAGHPNSVTFFIKPEHLPELRDIANRYYQAFAEDGVERPLSLNDMTLPFGGLFDVDHNWEPPHRSHRDGTDLDINRNVNDVIIECSNEDKKLIGALQHVLPNVRHTAPGDTNSALLCEKTWSPSRGDYIYQYHIDFEIQGEGT